MSNQQVVCQFHDDWLLWTVYSDGSVRQAMTEMWPEHGLNTNWKAAMARAASDEPRFAGGLLRFALEVPEVTQDQFFSLLNAWSLTLADNDMGYAQ